MNRKKDTNILICNFKTDVYNVHVQIKIHSTVSWSIKEHIYMLASF